MNIWRFSAILALIGCLVLAVRLHQVTKRLPPEPLPKAVDCTSQGVSSGASYHIDLSEVRDASSPMVPNTCRWARNPVEDHAIYCELNFTTRCDVPEQVPIPYPMLR